MEKLRTGERNERMESDKNDSQYYLEFRERLNKEMNYLSRGDERTLVSGPENLRVLARLSMTLERAIWKRMVFTLANRFVGLPV